MLMHDIARLHVAPVVQHYLEEDGIISMARSPDLNPTETSEIRFVEDYTWNTIN